MSEIARWSYANTATVKPFVSLNGETDETIYGAEYEIACGWIAEAKETRDAGRNVEFVSAYVIFTEDNRPRYRDLILLDSPDAPWQEIRARLEWEMAAFNDAPDYKLVT